MLLTGYSFWQRAGILAAILLFVAVVELLLKRRKARRWKEYTFLFLVAGAGALFGILVDQITSRISPEYFLYVKWLPAEDFGWQVINLGAKAGFSAGIIAGAVLLAAIHPRKTDLPRSVWPVTGELKWPLLGAIGAALLLGVIFGVLLPDAVALDYTEVVREEKLARFKAVMGAHYGLYAGGIAGTILAVVRLRRARR